ncbi:MAG: hypothetical protein AB7H86_17920 [Blastocatellales bacterium]
MRKLRLMAVAIGVALTLSATAFSISTRSSAPQADEPIRVKGGSLTIECPGNQDCFGSASNGRYSHRNGSGKIGRIVIKNTRGEVVADIDDQNALGPRPEIEIYYK